MTVVIAALTGVMKGVKWVGSLIDDFREFMTDWRGDPARPEIGYGGRAGVMARMHAMEEQLKKVHHEVVPNGGGSLRDSVNRIETAVSPAMEEVR